ncbi:hypothetical protein VP01_413g2 [Puccinia sorghi]|uniref:Uncharacterized protein n=1 Tax=Puccinia sorghi TaxID=27349 RepID=A0A0L6UR29_9BASI|nr:hypothetical protein VP01_413g2 [Puccinia sorghi]
MAHSHHQPIQHQHQPSSSSSTPPQNTTPPSPAPADNPKPIITHQANNPPATSQTSQDQPSDHLLRDKVHSLSKDWLAGMRADFLEIQGPVPYNYHHFKRIGKYVLMDINHQISHDFGEWVEADCPQFDSLVRQEKALRDSLKDLHFLETQTAAERDRMDLAITEMKRITDRLVDPASSHATDPPNNL